MIVDLTHPLKNKISVYPGSSDPSFDKRHTVEKDGFAEIAITMSTHTGTHIDAPAHILAGTKTLDQFPLEKFVGPGVVVDCSDVKEISLGLLQKYEERIKRVDFVLFYTGWQDRWSTEKYLEAFPTLTEEATRWLTNFELKALGFDVISVDAIGAEVYINHNILLEKEILIIENMNNLDQLISRSFELNCIPLYIENADGAPVRAFAKSIT